MRIKYFNTDDSSGRRQKPPDFPEDMGNGEACVFPDVKVRERPRQGSLFRIDLDDEGPSILGESGDLAGRRDLRGCTDHEQDRAAFRLGFRLLLRVPRDRLPEQDEVRLEDLSASAPWGDSLQDLRP